MKSKLLLLTAALGLVATSGWAQLTTGDLSIIGFNSENPDQITFVLWEDITSGTQIYFGDNGFDNSNQLYDNEGDGVWEATSNLSAGTVIQLDPASDSASVGTFDSTSLSLATTGDQIFAGTTDLDTAGSYAGTLLHGINSNGSDWQSSGGQDTNESYLPSALNVTHGNIHISAENAQYTGSRSFTSLGDAKNAVHNTSNWTTSTSPLSLDTTVFTIPESSSIVLITIVGLAALGVLRNRK